MDEDFVFFLSFMPKIQGKDVLKSKQSRKPQINEPFRLWCFRFSPASCFYAREQSLLSSFLFHGRSLLSKSRYFVSSFSRQNFLSFFYFPFLSACELSSLVSMLPLSFFVCYQKSFVSAPFSLLAEQYLSLFLSCLPRPTQVLSLGGVSLFANFCHRAFPGCLNFYPIGEND